MRISWLCSHLMLFAVAPPGCGDEPAEPEAGTEVGPDDDGTGSAADTTRPEADSSGDGGASSSSSDAEETETDDDDGGPPPQGEPAAGITLGEVRANQAVDITLVQEGVVTTDAERAAPIIAGRPMLVRAAYAVAPEFVARPILGRLWLTQDDGTNDVYEEVRDVSGAGSLNELGDTFSWQVDAEAVQGATEFRIELLEADGATADGDASGASVPASGFAPIDAWDDPMVLDVVVVPFSCSGLGAVEITPEDLADFENYLFNTYPIQALNLEVHEVVPATSCSAFDAAEYDLPDLRQAEGAAPWVYYGGLLPGDGGGYSIAIQDSDQMSFRRTFANHTWRWYGLTFDLFAHELGHNHGRDHTFEDGAYPGNNAGSCGTRETFGWGPRSGMMPNSAFSNDQELGIPWIDPHEQLVPPTAESCDGLPNANEGNHNDFMSYAYPYWISAYTYAAIADRVRLISSWRGAAAPPQSDTTIHRVVVSPEGRVTTSTRPGTLEIDAPAGQAWCDSGAVAVHRGRAIGERFAPNGPRVVDEYTSYEFAAPNGDACTLQLDGLDVAVP